MLTSDDILSEYSRVKTSLGFRPTFKEFLSRSNVTRYNMTLHFRTYNRLVKAAGDTPLDPVARNTAEESVYFTAFGNYLRRHRSLPAIADWIHRRLTPGYRSYLHKFKCKWSEFPYIFLRWASPRPDWKDVLPLIPVRAVTAPCSAPWEAADPKLFDAAPPLVHDIIRLSHADGTPQEFEKKCALALRILGFDVRELGLGSGRNPDGIAKDTRSRYAVIYDAKSRKDHYTIGTDDRQYIEYINRHKKDLHHSGYETIYFLIISSKFGAILPDPLKRVRMDTGISMALLTAENLLRIISHKTMKPYSLDPDKLKQIFAIEGEITKEALESILK